MAIGETINVNSVREQLLAGRERLSDVLAGNESEQMLRLLEEVDSALHRIDHGAFGVCEVCAGVVPSEELLENPLARVCLECLTPKQQRALEYDLELAAQIQKGLLPPADLAISGWEISYHYQPAGMVSGDYCDVIQGRWPPQLHHGRCFGQGRGGRHAGLESARGLSLADTAAPVG